MKLEKLNLLNFRNHNDTEIEFSPTVNLIVGKNGQGKTNLLEAVAYLSFGKSFFSAADSLLIKKGGGEFVVRGLFKSDSGIDCSVGIRYSESERKKELRINNKDESRIASLIGSFPVVLLYPEQHSITSGSPAERRRFMDMALSQAHSGYFEALTEYRKTLKQRNCALADCRAKGVNPRSIVEPWDEPFLNYAVAVTEYRHMFIREISPTFKENYKKIAENDESPEIIYDSSAPWNGELQKKQQIDNVRKAFVSTFDAEKRYGTTVFGPHRDELVLLINDMEARKYASQGQQKSLLIALKITESQYLLEKRNEQPLILLDDLFGELDCERSKKVIELTTGMGQTFITSADTSICESKYGSLNGYVKFVVENGRVSNV